MSYSVYKHTFPNGKIYIGITSRKPEYRWGKDGSGYFTKKNNGEYCQPLIAYAILKYGWNNIGHEVLFDNLSKKEAEQKEIELIFNYESNQRKYGYNIDNGGNCIGTHSEETKKKISEGNKGKSMSEDAKKKISQSQKGENGYWYGKLQSEQTKDKRIKSLKKYYKNHIHHTLGKSLSEEHKNKISNGNKGRKISEETKKKMSDSKEKTKVRCIETGKVYESIAYVRKELGINHVWSVCNGKRKTAGGYHWEFVNKEEIL